MTFIVHLFSLPYIHSICAEMIIGISNAYEFLTADHGLSNYMYDTFTYCECNTCTLSFTTHSQTLVFNFYLLMLLCVHALHTHKLYNYVLMLTTQTLYLSRHIPGHCFIQK